jgi:hypothetical protein
LQRVKTFLPEIEKANQNIPKELPKEKEDHEGPYIEMVLKIFFKNFLETCFGCLGRKEKKEN